MTIKASLILDPWSLIIGRTTLAADICIFYVDRFGRFFPGMIYRHDLQFNKCSFFKLRLVTFVIIIVSFFLCKLREQKQSPNIGLKKSVLAIPTSLTPPSPSLSALQHSCSPNLFVQNVFVDTHDLRFPWVAFFASKYVSRNCIVSIGVYSYFRTMHTSRRWPST